MSSIDLPMPVFAHPGIPTPSWQPRCELCRLSRDNSEAYEYVTRALLGGSATQQEIADQLHERFGVNVTQPQVSNHRRKHLLPDLQAAHETFAATQALLAYLGDVEPVDLAKRVQGVALMKCHMSLQSAEEPRDIAALSQAIRALSKGISDVEMAGIEQEAKALDVQTRQLKLDLQQGNYREAFVAYVEQHYPHLVPALSGEADAGNG